jgi:hypothetical protein
MGYIYRPKKFQFVNQVPRSGKVSETERNYTSFPRLPSLRLTDGCSREKGSNRRLRFSPLCGPVHPARTCWVHSSTASDGDRFPSASQSNASTCCCVRSPKSSSFITSSVHGVGLRRIGAVFRVLTDCGRSVVKKQKRSPSAFAYSTQSARICLPNSETMSAGVTSVSGEPEFQFRARACSFVRPPSEASPLRSFPRISCPNTATV